MAAAQAQAAQQEQTQVQIHKTARSVVRMVAEAAEAQLTTQPEQVRLAR